MPPHLDRRALLFESALMLLPAALFALIAGYHITLPGLYYDEAADAVPAMYLLQHVQPEMARPHGVPFGGLTLPLMVFDYVGSVSTYAVLPLFAALGPGVVALRLMCIAGGAATVALTYLWGRSLFHSRWVGAAAALLLATHPSFVFYARQGVHVSSLMALWQMAALCLLMAWQRTGRARWLAAAAFLLGVGLWTKIVFLWVDVALLGCYGLWRLPTWWSALRRSGPIAAIAQHLRPAQVAATMGAFALGLSPFIVFNLQTGATFSAVGQASGVTAYGVQNSAYLANLGERLGTLGALLTGDHFWFLGGLFGNPLFVPATLAAVVAVGVLVLRTPALRAPVAFTLGFTLLYLLQSPFTVSGIWPTHVFLLLPVLAVVVALALRPLVHRGRAGMAAATAALLLLTAGNVNADAGYHRALVETGGLRGQSDAIYDLAAYLDTNGIPVPMAMDWGIRYPLELLTQGRVRPIEVFGYTPEPDPAFPNRLWLDVPEQRYLFHSDDYTTYPRLAAFQQVVAAAGKQAKLEATFYERNGSPIYLVYSAG